MSHPLLDLDHRSPRTKALDVAMAFIRRIARSKDIAAKNDARAVLAEIKEHLALDVRLSMIGQDNEWERRRQAVAERNAEKDK